MQVFSPWAAAVISSLRSELHAGPELPAASPLHPTKNVARRTSRRDRPTRARRDPGSANFEAAQNCHLSRPPPLRSCTPSGPGPRFSRSPTLRPAQTATGPPVQWIRGHLHCPSCGHIWTGGGGKLELRERSPENCDTEEKKKEEKKKNAARAARDLRRPHRGGISAAILLLFTACLCGRFSEHEPTSSKLGPSAASVPSPTSLTVTVPATSGRRGAKLYIQYVRSAVAAAVCPAGY